MVAEYHAPSLWLFHPPQQWDVAWELHLKYSGEARDKRRLLLFSPVLSANMLGDAGLDALSARHSRKLKLNFKQC